MSSKIGFTVLDIIDDHLCIINMNKRAKLAFPEVAGKYCGGLKAK